MTETKPKIYPAEFEASAVKLAIESNRPVAQTAKELGVNSWVDKYSRPKESMIRTDKHLYDELKRLKKDLARVTQERDLLKKAAAYFAKESQ